MSDTRSWLSKIFRRPEKGSPQRLNRQKIDQVLRRSTDPRPEQPPFLKTDYGAFTHVDFLKASLLRNPNLVDIVDPITKKMRRIDTSKEGNARTTGFYKADGSLIND